MKKMLSCPNSRHTAPVFAAPGRPLGLLLSAALLGALLAGGCGDGTSPAEVSTTADDDATSSGATSSPEQETPPPNEPVPSETRDDSVSADDADMFEGTVSEVKADAGRPGAMPPMAGNEPGEMTGDDCGGEGQACCDQEHCRPGFVCSSGSPADAGDASISVCQRDPAAPIPPEGDAGPPAPPGMPPAPGPGLPPAPEGDAGPPAPPAPGPGMPPTAEGDAGPPAPPGMPPAPHGDAGPPVPPNPLGDCGSESERCCEGPGGRCDEGLRCENPNGPELSDSECVTTQ